MKYIILSITLLWLYSSYSHADEVDIAFIYTPDGFHDAFAVGANEPHIVSHLNSHFSEIGSNLSFRNVGSYVMQNYQESYYGDDVYEDFNDTSAMHYDILTAPHKPWVKDLREKRKLFAADIIIFIPGDADVEADAGGQGPGDYFGYNGGYILVPGKFTFDAPIFSHEIKHVYGMNHAEISANTITDLFTNDVEVANFENRYLDAHLWSDDFVGPVSNSQALKYSACDTRQNQRSRWNYGDLNNAIAFYNQTPNSLIGVYWIDYAGNEVLQSTLSPGEAYGVSTYSQHPWIIRNLFIPYDCLGIVTNKGTQYENLYIQ